MSSPSYQSQLLAPSLALIRRACADQDDRPGAGLDVIEAAASRLGGFDLDGYREALGVGSMDTGLTYAWADKLLASISATPVPPRLALAALAQPQIERSRTKATGAFYTDWRLAAYLAEKLLALPGPAVTPQSAVIDAAAGTGILLAALVAAVCGDDAAAATELVGSGVCASDVDPEALRGTAAVLASFTADHDAITRMRSRLVPVDSLLAPAEHWHALSPQGFDAVIGNPPWERLRGTRHETLQASGVQRHYGDDYDVAHRKVAPDGRARRYADAIAARYPLVSGREIDLYQPFVELGLRLGGEDGRLGLLVPAGLVRSQGTQPLRAHLMDEVPAVEMAVFHNRARFFGIDTRVKFLALTASRAGRRRAPLRLRHATADAAAVVETASTAIGRAALASARPDRSVPEVRGDAEWRMFQRMSRSGATPADPDGPWRMRIVREVDMTNDRALFSRCRSAGTSPVVEGRMLQHHRSRSKAYVAGTGRAAQWDAVPLQRGDEVRSQFYLRIDRLPAARQARAASSRVGFCDIVGQTNERTLQAAVIGPGQICGNKVPTVDLLSHQDDPDRPFVLVAVLNSLPVDWLLRRVVTTSLNYFVLLGLALPRVEPGSPLAGRLAGLGRSLHGAEGAENADMREVAQWRAEIDALVLDAYGLGPEDMRLMLDDFPLLDRGQPALPGESRSTATRDLLQGVCDPTDTDSQVRHACATAFGAVAYVPEEFAAAYRMRS